MDRSNDGSHGGTARSPAPLKVLLMTPDYPPAIGGIQVLLHRLVAEWPHDEVRVVSIDDYDGNRKRPRRSSQFRPRLGHRAAVGLLNLRAIRESIRFRPDVVVSAHIVTGPAALATKLMLGTPYVQYIYASEVPPHVWLARLAIRGSAAVIAISQYARSLVAELGGAARIEIIHPGVDHKDAPVAVHRAGRPTVIVVARLDDLYKGHDVLIRSLALVRAAVPGAHLLIVGDGYLRPHYASLAEAIGLSDAVTFVGAVPDSERDALLEQAHVFAMPSRIPPSAAGEGFGIAYLEAGMHRLPVVGGSVGGAVDAVLDGVTGLLVDPSDHVEVARAITRLLLDRDLADKLGGAGREWALEHTWAKMARSVADVTRSVVVADR